MTIKRSKLLSHSIAALLMASALAVPAYATEDAKQMEELRNTVVNLLEGLVQRGVLTREQAQAMVKDAQDKAAAEAKDKADQDAAEKDAVRVTYVPETVRKQISDEVSAELEPQVTKAVVAQAKAEKWGVPGALPSWVSALTLYGDMRVRQQLDNYADENATNTYLDFLAVNRAGGIGKAGPAAILNTTEDRMRTRLRARFGVNASITNGVSAGIRLATGNPSDPVSTNQTLGNTAARYPISVDQAYLQFDSGSNAEVPWLTVWGGRMPNPWNSTDLVWDQDLNFEGIATTGRWNFNGSKVQPRQLFLTAGAFPLQEVELSPDDKWLYGGQLGIDWTWQGGMRARLAAAYYYFNHVTGIRNTVDSTLFDYTAPQFLQKGNTLFDIRNDADPATNLFALAAEYKLQSLTLSLDIPLAGHKLMLTGDYVKNVGFDSKTIYELTGANVDKRNVGYQVEMTFGTQTAKLRGDWRGAIEYRYIERDAVMDAFTDSDFHLGGTDAKGYVLKADWWMRDKTFLSLRYLSSSEIDGPPLSIDTLMIDITGQF